jgi:hypothetical protein
MNTASNTRLRLTTQVGQVHATTRVLLDLGTNNEPHRPENAAEHKPRALLTYTGQAGVAHRSDRSKPESPKTPNRPTDLQNDPNLKQQQDGTRANSPKRSSKQNPIRVCTGQTGVT